MALSMDVTVNVFVTKEISGTVVSREAAPQIFEACYIKIVSIAGDKDLLSFIAEGEKDGLKVLEYRGEFSPVTGDEGADFIRQGYLYMKGLVGFQAAIDC